MEFIHATDLLPVRPQQRKYRIASVIISISGPFFRINVLNATAPMPINGRQA
jgi:hypothetical protein